MSYKGYDGVDIMEYPYKQFKTWTEAWSEATWDKPVGPMRGRPKPKVYRKPFRDYDTAAEIMEPNSVGVYGTGANRMWIVTWGYSSEW